MSFAIIAAENKVTKVGAGYVHKDGVDYRCRECWDFDSIAQRCASHGPTDVIKPNGTCTYWRHGIPTPGLAIAGSITKQESGYTEDPNGTLCRRCKFFFKGDCEKVNKNSPGDDPGQIHPMACCANQTPRAA